MPQIYKYYPYTTPGPHGTKIFHKSDDENLTLTIGTHDNAIYISVPEGVTLPEQPAEITLEEVSLTFESREFLRRNMLAFATTRKLADDKIRETIGDTDDQIADLAKRIGMVERLVMRMAQPLLQNQPVPEAIKDSYLPIVEGYIEAIDNGGVRDRVDLESNIRIAQILTERFAAIAGIVDDLHISRVKSALGES